MLYLRYSNFHGDEGDVVRARRVPGTQIVMPSNITTLYIPPRILGIVGTVYAMGYNYLDESKRR